MRILPALFCLLLACAPARAEGPSRAEAAARGLSPMVSPAPAGAEGHFDKKFFQQVPLAYIEEVFKALHRQAGAVTGMRAERREGDLAGRFVWTTAGGYEIPFTLGLDPASGKVSQLFIKPPYKKDATLASVEKELAALPGRAGLLALRYGKENSRLAGLGEKEYFAVASVFKLYVLGAMLEEQVPWARVYRLSAADKSLPTGQLRNWSDGSPLTAHTLAVLMIADSDNTATDALISAVGRRRIESRLAALGHSDPARLKPFLRTSELFRLRSDTETAVKYINLPLDQKYGFLDGLAAPLDAGKVRRGPFDMERLEWQASPADICAALGYFREKGDSEALSILGVNKGVDIPPGFAYAGYKGGMEEGVLSAAWLLRRGKDDWYCLSGVWNSGKEPVDERKFFGLMSSALRALASAE